MSMVLTCALKLRSLFENLHSSRKILNYFDITTLAWLCSLYLFFFVHISIVFICMGHEIIAHICLHTCLARNYVNGNTIKKNDEKYRQIVCAAEEK